MKPNVDYSLYLVTDRDLMSAPTMEETVAQAIAGGCTVVQLREKDMGGGAFLAEARAVLPITRAAGVPLIINDRVDVALAVGADGVHVGQSDLPAREVRRLIGPDMLLGVSCATMEEAMAAQADGADYLGVGAMFATDTKTDTRPVSKETLCAIRAAVDIPIVIIGGINPKTAPLFYGTGISGLAVVSAIVAQPDIAAAARQLKEMSKEL